MTIEKEEAVKWTPGPWRYQEGADVYTHIIRAGASGLGRFIASSPQGSDGTDRANAHLIAAVPELYEAAMAAKKYLEPDLVEPGRTVFWKLVAALSKARGKSK